MILKTKEDTIKKGIEISKNLQAGDILCLHGNLGTGKTTLTQGLAIGLKIKENITSPTFALMNIYNIKNGKIKNFVHIDTYRLKSEEDLIEIGIEDYLGAKNTICVIEWPEKIEKLLKNKKTIDITIEHSCKNERLLRISQ